MLLLYPPRISPGVVRSSFPGSCVRQMGPEHPHSMHAARNLGRLYTETGELDLAQPLLEESRGFTSNMPVIYRF